MNALLGSLLVLSTFVTLCNAQCFFTKRDSTWPEGCKDSKGISHPLQSTWTNDCNKCTCSSGGIACCRIAGIPVGYDKKKCKKIFYQDECTFRVVERDNPYKTCEVKAWIL
ncbi:PREDICTED: beta-microseminoprotein [Condylura cristata]|uniref:beta-microseminoprotein n=1 Tax=Condylura cristata TaxID=143302 RepID=UPI000643C26F|nr:PREDICTED: beta-microseminoprotein [Condylura cristata]